MRGPTAAAVALVALAVDLVLGDPPNRWHPVAWLGSALGHGTRRLARGSPGRLLLGGGALTLGVMVLAALAAWLVTAISAWMGPAGLVLEALALKSTLSLHGLGDAARRVAADLDRGDLAAARSAVGVHLVSRPTGMLGETQVASAAVESVAENLSDSFMAPLLFFLLLGLPGAAAYRALNTADAMIGYREGALEHFGKVAARLDDFANLAPARLAAAALVGAAALTGGNVRGAAAVAWSHHARTASPNAGWTMGAMAGALGVALEKPGHYRLGDGRAPGADDIRRSVRTLQAAALLGTGVLVTMSLMIQAG